MKNRSPLVYDGEVKKLIYKLKFGKKTYIAQTLGALMADKFIECGFDSEIIVFVPMTDEEVKKRGFNQAELLAYEVGNRLNIAVLPALVKVKDTSQQKELKGKDRANNLRRCVCLRVRASQRKKDFAYRRRFHYGRDRKRVRKDVAQSESERSVRADCRSHAT